MDENSAKKFPTVIDDVQIERIERQIECFVKHEKELRTAAEQALREKMLVQSKELARRLGILNDHQGKLESDRDKFVHKEAYNTWKRGVDRWIANQDGARRGIAIAWAVFWVIFGGIGMVVAFLK